MLTLTSFLNDISSEMVVNILPLFLFSVLGVSTAAIGLIEGVAESTSSLLKLGSGWMSDRIQARKPLTVAGYGLSTLVKPALYFAVSWPMVLLVRFTDRVGKGLRTAPRDALIADSVPEEQRGLAFGLHRAGDTAGAAIGILLAMGVVLLVQRGAAALNRQTFQYLILLSLIPAIAGVLVLIFGAKDVMPRFGEDKSRKVGLGGFSSQFYFYLGILMLFTLGNSADAFLIIRAGTLGLSVLGILGLMLAFNLVYTLLSTPAGALSDRWDRRVIIVGGWSIYALVYFGFARASATWQVWVLILGYGVYYALSEGAARAYVADLVPERQRGTAFGLFNASVALMALPANLIAGILWQGLGEWSGLGPSAPFLFGGLLALLAAVLLAIQPSKGTITLDESSIDHQEGRG